MYINHPFEGRIILLMLSLKVCVLRVNLVKPCLKTFLQTLIFFQSFFTLKFATIYFHRSDAT